MDFKEALKEILKIKGISALESPSTLKLLEDYGAFDEYPIFCSIMENIIAMKAGEMLQNTFYYSVEDKGQAWGQMKKKLLEGLPFDEVFLNLFLADLEYAFMGYAYEKGSYDRNLNSDVEEMLGQVWTDDRGVKYSADKKRLINASEIAGTYVVYPTTEYVDSYAFQQNSKIERVILPKKLKKIGSHAFQICPYLTKIEFQDGISEIDECAFGGCALTEVYLPNGLHRISDALFSTCTNLLYVHIPKSVTSIGVHAFNNCHSLQYVVIPDNVTSIGDFAFQWCKSLYYVILPSTLTSVGEKIFDNCKSLRYLGIPKGTKSKFILLMPQYANLFVEYEQAQSNEKMIVIKRDILNYYQGKTKVIHCVMADGREAWLSQERSFADETASKGACKINTIENDKKHVLYLFNDNNEEVGSYYLGKKLQGMPPEQIVENKERIAFFDSWNPENAKWVPCVGFKSSGQSTVTKGQKPPFPASDKENNNCEFNLHICEVDINAKGDFQKIEEEEWTIGDKIIETPHGSLHITDTIFVDKGDLVGVQFSVKGQLRLNELTCSVGNGNPVNIKTFALMRQPHNVWLWVYVFDINDNPIVNFCGYDDLDGFSKFVPSLKRLKEKVNKTIWENDSRLYGIWYGIDKNVHPVLGTDYSLIVNCYNEDGTMFKHVQLGVKNLNFSKNIRWSKYLFKWTTNNNEIIVTNEELNIKETNKYEFIDGYLIVRNIKYYQTLEEAIQSYH